MQNIVPSTTRAIYTPNYIETAYHIGKQLARDAIWSADGRCNWQGASLEVIKGKYEIATVTFNAGIYSGLSGIALFLAELYLRVPDMIIEKVLHGTVKNILHQHEKQPIGNDYSFYSGQLGVGFTLWKLGLMLQNETYKKQGLKIIKQLKNRPVPDGELDLIGGAAGAIPVLLGIYTTEKQKIFLDLANKCGQFLLDKAVKNPTSWHWISIGTTEGLTGYSHGAAGISLALLELYTHTKKEKYQEAAMKGFQFEREHFNYAQNNWPDRRNGKGNQSCMTMWCHGAPGIALSRLKAYQLTQNQDFLEEAKVALNTTYRDILHRLNNPTVESFCLCHGLAGNAEVLLIGGLMLNIPAYSSLAKQVANIGIELYDKTNIDWKSGINDPSGKTKGQNYTPGLMLGSSGVGYFYLRMAFPNEIGTMIML